MGYHALGLDRKEQSCYHDDVLMHDCLFLFFMVCTLGGSQTLWKYEGILV